jgi:hypothetical protein
MSETKGLKTELAVRLHAGDVLVAESSDPVLWQQVMASITAGRASIQVPAGSGREGGAADPGQGGGRSGAHGDANGPVAKLAADIGVTVEALVGALDPQDHAPFIHIDVRNWEAYRKNFPKRGATAVPKITLAATALVLWFRHAGLGNPTQAQAQTALQAINDPEPNPSRSIRNCDWLQSRQDGVTLNPAQASKARRLLKAFCEKTGWTGDS